MVIQTLDITTHIFVMPAATEFDHGDHTLTFSISVIFKDRKKI